MSAENFDLTKDDEINAKRNAFVAALQQLETVCSSEYPIVYSDGAE